MPDIKNDAAGMGLGEGGIEFSVGKNNGKLLSEYVSVNVARPHFFENQVLVSSLRSRPEIVHDGNIRERGGFDRTVDRTPRHVFPIPGFLRPVVGSLYSHNEVGISFDRGGAKLRVHLVQALLEPTAHAVRDDIQKGQDSDFGAVDDFFLLHEKCLSTRGAGVHDGSHA
jgi:hypothetical protein